MRKRLALASLLAFSWLGGPEQDAKAGVTVDVVFQEAWSTVGLEVLPGDPGPGCSLGGKAGGSVSTGHCMDVVMTVDEPGGWVGFSTSVSYVSNTGGSSWLAIGAMYEWRGLQVMAKRCDPLGGLTDTGSRIESFDCAIQGLAYPPTAPAGTYTVGTIVWNTSGGPGFATIAAVINDLIDGAAVVVNGNLVRLDSEAIVTHFTTITVPEAGTAVLLGAGFVGLALMARRRRPPAR